MYKRPVRLVDVDPALREVEGAIRRRLVAAGRDPSEASRIALGRRKSHRAHWAAGSRYQTCEWCRLEGGPPDGYRVTSHTTRVDPLPPDEDRAQWDPE